MIISRLRGGLGNQMFQYAIGRHLSIKNNTELFLDDSFLAGPGIASSREYELDVFSIKAKLIENADLKRFKKSKIYNKLNKYLKFDKNIIIESSLEFNPKLLKTKDNFLIDGYWQTEKYFTNIKNEIASDFKLKNPLGDKLRNLISEIRTTNSISIHIRRGDYITDKKTSKHHGSCSLDYYRKAIKIMSEKIMNPIFYIFSDDIKWAKENLKLEYPAEYNEGNKGFEDLELMKNCKHNIIANSSFSWWSAWLNTNKNKIVIAPKKWLNNSKFNTDDVVPETWIKI